MDSTAGNGSGISLPRQSFPLAAIFLQCRCEVFWGADDDYSAMMLSLSFLLRLQLDTESYRQNSRSMEENKVQFFSLSLLSVASCLFSPKFGTNRNGFLLHERLRWMDGWTLFRPLFDRLTFSLLGSWSIIFLLWPSAFRSLLFSAVNGFGGNESFFSLLWRRPSVFSSLYSLSYPLSSTISSTHSSVEGVSFVVLLLHQYHTRTPMHTHNYTAIPSNKRISPLSTWIEHVVVTSPRFGLLLLLLRINRCWLW